ncbi:hypothetical protein TCAL_16806 [Tigriopus californicus]|uniref:Uncharacterized protein n=1 Tax=Tigriopus californicus TaxID=6832 RepID=A0A553P9V6_TIGCA|nr:hypothetical protein TCAL_16806 [Tigriopus californicus]
METIPSVDNALRTLFATSTISQDRSVLSPKKFGTPESKIMFTAEFVFSKIQGLAKHGITCSQDLIKYMNCHPQTYVCHENCVLSRELWNVMPCEFDAFIEFANLFRYHSGYNRQYLLAAVQENEILQIRLKNMKSLRAFLRLFSEFFLGKKIMQQDRANALNDVVEFFQDKIRHGLSLCCSGDRRENFDMAYSMNYKAWRYNWTMACMTSSNKSSSLTVMMRPVSSP